MKKSVIIIITLGIVAVLAAIIGFIVFSEKATAPENEIILSSKTTNTNMTITSPSFQNNDFIPKQFTCDGENINPKLEIGDVPESAKSLVLIMDDPDAPRGTFTHWLLWNIDPKTSIIKEGSVPENAVEGKSGRGNVGYIGPCLPSGTHRYFFKLYALDAILNLPSGSSKTDLETEIRKHLIGEAEFVGLYERTK